MSERIDTGQAISTSAISTFAAGPGSSGGLRGAVACEWTKLWSVRATWVCLVVAAGLMVVYVLYYGALAAIYDRPVQPVAAAPISAMVLVQLAVVVLAVQSVTGEYATGSIRSTLLWVPVRGRLLAAKAVVVAAVGFVAGTLLGVLGSAVAWPAFQGHAVFEPGRVIAQVLLIGVYLALISVLSVGGAAALRSSAGAHAAVLTVLMALPGIVLAAGGDVMMAIYNHLPSTAGSHFMSGDSGPYSPVTGFLIVLAWTAVAWAAGHWVLRRRDA